jgi:DNA recombination protein RmuC
MDTSLLLAVSGAVLVAVALVLVVLRGGTLRRSRSDDVGARIDRLEAVLKETLSGSTDAVVARVGERFEGKHRELTDASREQLIRQERELKGAIEKLKAEMEKTLGDLREGLASRLGTSLADSTRVTNESLARTMKLATETLNSRFAELQRITDNRLDQISGKVSERLDEGFKKTQQTFVDVVTRLTIIDEAQKKIEALSRDVVSLQDILSDKKSRGVFGEVQLHQLVMNAMPEGTYALQHDLGSGLRADCVLFLPPPTGTIAVDAKFPLENYRRMFDPALPEAERQGAARLFKQDVRSHVEAIAQKYIVPGVTAEGAFMFVPAEAIFAEIHAHHPDLVELANRRRVFITSPTTMMAVLTTARAVLKDARTREQVHIIQEHLVLLANDFRLFQERMDKLATHIRQAHDDVEKVGTSAKKITSRFEKIEKVQLGAPAGAEEDAGDEPPGPDAPPRERAAEAGASELFEPPP